MSEPLKLVSTGHSVKYEDGRTKAMEGLDFDAITERMMLCEHDKSTYRKLAEYYGVNLSVLHGFLHLPFYKKRLEEVHKICADLWKDKGLEVLYAAESNSNWEENRVKNKIEYFDKMAGVLNRTKYGNKVEVKVELIPETPEERLALMAEIEKLALGGGEGNEQENRPE